MCRFRPARSLARYANPWTPRRLRARRSQSTMGTPEITPVETRVARETRPPRSRSAPLRLSRRALRPRSSPFPRAKGPRAQLVARQHGRGRHERKLPPKHRPTALRCHDRTDSFRTKANREYTRQRGFTQVGFTIPRRDRLTTLSALLIWLQTIGCGKKYPYARPKSAYLARKLIGCSHLWPIGSRQMQRFAKNRGRLR